MAFSRRFFLVGAGSLVTSHFVSEAKTFIADTKTPFLVAPAKANRGIRCQNFKGYKSPVLHALTNQPRAAGIGYDIANLLHLSANLEGQLETCAGKLARVLSPAS